ncbi:MAG: hypothetical protein Q8Q91_00720, partial [Candidatus Daviesbacteria bacterium]|nr:hypothetical protein [Candidatus Daviesbacteria bacterium]
MHESFLGSLEGYVAKATIAEKTAATGILTEVTDSKSLNEIRIEAIHRSERRAANFNEMLILLAEYERKLKKEFQERQLPFQKITVGITFNPDTLLEDTRQRLTNEIGNVWR